MRPAPEDVLLRLGGAATAADLVAVCGKSAVRRSVDAGRVVRLARGRYAAPHVTDPRRAAVRLCGVVSHLSAARLWDLQVAERSAQPHVTVGRHRRRVRPQGAVMHWADLRADEVVRGVTSPLRTVLDCARTLDPAAALSVADSALRQQLIAPSELLAAAMTLRGAGRRKVLWVAEHADPRAESALESVLRALLLLAGISGFEPQIVIADRGLHARVDLADRQRRIVLEADSFEHHGHRSALARDCRRYDELVVRGWRVLRFAWEQVMFEPEWVTAVVRRATEAAG